MQLPLLLLNLAGATALLLYAVRMVRTGIERASGPALRTLLIDHRRGRLTTAAMGVVLAVMLQSSTAAAILTVGFAASGLIGFAGGLALLLGADLGSALVVQFLSFRLDWLIPLLLAAGGILFLKLERRAAKQAGRVLLGIALVLLSLRLIGEATLPLRESAALPVIVGFLEGDPVTAFLLGALFAFALHSSVAAILIVVTFVSRSVVPLDLGISLVLGANLGGALLAVWLTRGAGVVARRIPVGNLMLRGCGALAALALVQAVTLPLAVLTENPAQQLVWLHLGLNLAILLIGLALVGPLQAFLELIMPKPSLTAEAEEESLRPASALDQAALRTPEVALANTTREVLRMAELVEVMARPVMELYETGDRPQIAKIARLDDAVDRAFADIKLYIAALNRGQLSEKQKQRSLDLADFAINLESAGDIVAKRLLPLAKKKDEFDVSFSREGWGELTTIHDRIMVNMQMAINVLVSEDVDAARRLVEEKDRIRLLERNSRNEHLHRLRRGGETSVNSSNIHLETLRAFKEVNALFASVAQTLLLRRGLLRDTRLVEQGEPLGAGHSTAR